MKRFALLNNNKVSEVIKTSSLKRLKELFHKDIISACVEVPTGQQCKEGYSWNGNKFVKPDIKPVSKEQKEINILLKKKQLARSATPEIIAFLVTLDGCPQELKDLDTKIKGIK